MILFAPKLNLKEPVLVTEQLEVHPEHLGNSYGNSVVYREHETAGVELTCLSYLLGGFSALIGEYGAYATRLKVANRQTSGEDCFHASLIGAATAAWVGLAAQLYLRFQNDDLFRYVYVGLVLFTCGAAIHVNRRNPRTSWRTAVFWFLLGGGCMVLASSLYLSLVS